MDGTGTSTTTGFVNPLVSSSSPLPAGAFPTGEFYKGMVKPTPAPVAPVVTPTETAKKSTKCTKLAECVCGSLLGCLIAANGDVELFF